MVSEAYNTSKEIMRDMQLLLNVKRVLNPAETLIECGINYVMDTI